MILRKVLYIQYRPLPKPRNCITRFKEHSQKENIKGLFPRLSPNLLLQKFLPLPSLFGAWRLLYTVHAQSCGIPVMYSFRWLYLVSDFAVPWNLIEAKWRKNIAMQRCFLRYQGCNVYVVYLSTATIKFCR